MIKEGRSETIQYIPPPEVRRKFLLKKGVSLLAFGLMGTFVIWFAWPGITRGLVPLDQDFWTFFAGILLAFGALCFLVVVAWNERVPRIRDGIVDLPFPIQRTDRSRTRRIAVDEIASIELTTNSIGLSGAEIFLRDRTRLFLPARVFGDAGRNVLEALVAHVSRRS